MKKYRVLARTIVFKEVGVFEANSEDEAISMAIDNESTELTLCYHCSKDVNGIELDTFITEEE